MSDALANWLATTYVAAFAKAYIASGYKIFPCHGVTTSLKCTCGNADCTNVGKHPFTKHGLNDASGDIEEVAKMFQYRDDLNIAIRTGEVSGFFALDIDDRKGGNISIDKLQSVYGSLPPTPVSITGNGGHLFFNYPGVKTPSRSDVFGDQYPGIDIRADGGYIIAPPSMHSSGRQYKFYHDCPNDAPNAPAWVLEIILKKTKKEIKPLKNDSLGLGSSEWSVDEVNNMLDTIDPDISYNDWLHIGMALHQGGFSLSLWDNWSRGGQKYENGDCEGRWHGFTPSSGITMGTLVEMAMSKGWKPKPVDRPPVDIDNIAPIIKKAEKKLKAVAEAKKKEVSPEPVPAPTPVPAVSTCNIVGFNAMELPGLIGDTVRWITKYAIRKQPELALMNTLAFAGAVFGRKYASPLNTRTNLYAVGIADTGAGKEFSRKMIRELASASGLQERIGADDVRSDSGLLKGLMNNSSQVMMIDEFGIFLQGIANDRSPHYIRAVSKILLRLYSISNSVYNHGEYADPRAEPIIINYPNLSIYGTSTEEAYSKSLKKSSIENGDLNRFVTIRARSEKVYPDEDIPFSEIDEGLKIRWSAFAPHAGASLGEIVNNSDMAPEVVRVEWGQCKAIQYAIQKRQIDKIYEKNPYRHLWGRMHENTIKIAMMFAIARDKFAPVFEPEDFDIAQMLVESSIEYLTDLASNHMAETPQEESNNEIVRAIQSAGGSMSRSDIMRKFRKLKRRDLDDTINNLIEQDVLNAERKKEDGAGRPSTIYTLIA